jgi:glycosyltransferase involved in cell wall biosynthesis
VTRPPAFSAKRERVLVLTPFAVRWSMAGGGGTTVSVNFIDALRAAGFDIDLVAPSGGAAGFDAIEGLRVREASRSRIPAVMGLRTLAACELNARLLLTALRAGRRNRPHVVYGFTALVTPALVLAGLLLRRPTVSMLFGTFLYPVLGRPMALVLRAAEVLAFAAPVTRLEVLDDGTRGDRVAERFRVPRSRLCFWRHGIDWDELAAVSRDPSVRTELGLPEDAPLLVSSSRLVDWKRIDRIIRILPRIRDVHPETLLAIAGSGPELESLETLASSLGIADGTRFVGSLSREQNLRLTAAADVFCSFYDYSNMGVSLIEALALGKASVVTNSGATAEIVQDGVSGIVVPPDDDRAAVEAINGLLADPARRHELGSAATERIRAQYPDVHERARWEVELVNEPASEARD